jgi:DNA repair/transcription protein MET18/MMS19
MQGAKSSRMSAGLGSPRLPLTACSESHEQSAYLVALASLIKAMPQTTYVHEMPTVSPTPNYFAPLFIIRFQLTPLLLRGLDLPDTEIRANVINTFISAAVGSECTGHSAISEHASTLVSTMLNNSMASEVSSTVRNIFRHSKVNSITSS